MSIVFSLLAALLASTAPVSDDASASASVSEQPGYGDPRRFATIMVASKGLDIDALDPALSLRLPDLALLRTWVLDEHSIAELGRYAFVHLALADEEGVLSIELITAEGDAYVRSFDARDGEDSERIAASVLVSLLASIEAEELEADRVDIQAPASADEREVERAVTVAKGEAATAPEPESEPDSPLDPDPDPESESEPDPLETPPESAAPILSSWELAPQLGADALFTLPDESYGHIGAGGATIGLLGRSPRGLLMGAQLRVLGRVRDETSLVRVRLTGMIGKAWRPKDIPIELPLAAVIGFEPWFLRQLGERVPASELGTQSTLSNLGLWFAPGWLREFETGPLAALRVGAQLELTAAFIFDDGLESIGLVQANGDPLYRLGGFEIGVGMSTAIYFRGLGARGGR